MNNNVILTAASELVEKAIVAFMFNFRGVGGSGGKFGGGVDEQDDVTAAINWLTSQPEVNAGEVGLLGYSFGVIASLPVACADERIKAMALVSPPLDESQISQLRDCAKPKLIICGTEDFVVSSQKAERINRESAEPKQFELISGADHFWQGYEVAMAEKVTAFFNNVLFEQV